MPATFTWNQGTAWFSGAKQVFTRPTSESQSEVVPIVERGAFDFCHDLLHFELTLPGTVSKDPWSGKFLDGNLKSGENAVLVLAYDFAHFIQIHCIWRTMCVCTVEHAFGVAAFDANPFVDNHHIGGYHPGIAGTERGDSKPPIGLETVV
jgi:hypothetical protein